MFDPSPGKGSGSFLRVILEVILAAGLNLGIAMAPVLFATEPLHNYEGTRFLPAMSEANEVPHIWMLNTGLPFLVAVIFGFFCRAPVWLLGPAFMLFFPVWTIVDILMGSGGHNLFPFEFLIDGLTAVYFILPVGLGRLARHFWDKRAAKRQLADQMDGTAR